MTTGFSRYRYAGRLALMCAFAAWTPHAAGESLPAISTGARLAANCAACHGTSGITEGIALPSLAGQGKGVLLVALKAFKSGARQGTIMPQIAKGYTDEQLALLAEYFAAQPTVPTAALPVTPDWIAARAGARPSHVAVTAPVAAPSRPPQRMAHAAAAPVSRIAVTGWLPERGAAAGSGAVQPILQPTLHVAVQEQNP